jgi:hypothetical protein
LDLQINHLVAILGWLIRDEERSNLLLTIFELFYDSFATTVEDLPHCQVIDAAKEFHAFFL